MITVSPITILGTASLTGGAGAKPTVGTDRLAPQRLQYFSSTVISLPHDGQYIRANLLGSPANLTLSEETENGRRLKHFELSDPISSTVPHHNELCAQLFSNRTNAGLVGHKCSVLLRTSGDAYYSL
jgi:hypothetical protein